MDLTNQTFLHIISSHSHIFLLEVIRITVFCQSFTTVRKIVLKKSEQRVEGLRGVGSIKSSICVKKTVSVIVKKNER